MMIIENTPLLETYFEIPVSFEHSKNISKQKVVSKCCAQYAEKKS